jgi:hypothetical protein
VQTHASQPGQFIGSEFNPNRGTFYNRQAQGISSQYRTIDLMPETLIGQVINDCHVHTEKIF